MRLVPGGFRTSAQHLLELAVERAKAAVGGLRSSRLQRLAITTLHDVARRWPELSSLIAAVLPKEPPAPPRATEPSPQPPRGSAEAVPSELRAAYLEQLRGSPDFAERVRAAQALGDARDSEVTTALAGALRDASSEVAVQAAESLERHGGPTAVEALREALRNADGFSSTATRAAAVRALGTLLARNDGAILATAVADPDATVSLAAIAALAGRDEAVSANTLLGVLEDRSAFYLPLTRQAAAAALTHLRPTDPPRVRALIETEGDPEVRRVLEGLAS